jgi:hypothetical protein
MFDTLGRVKKADIAVRSALVVAAGVVVWLLFFRSSVKVRDHATSTRPDALRVLFIGNSHTYVNDLPVAFGKLVAAKHPERSLALTDVTQGGISLADHLKDGTAAKTIARASWDYVVLQEASAIPGTAPAQFEDSVRHFDALVRAVHAKTVIYETWPHRGEPSAFFEFDKVAHDVGAILVRAGDAWMRALAKDPVLALYQPDDHHAAPAGTYLAACAFYATLLGEPTQGLPTLDMVSPQVAAEIQNVVTP